MKEFWIRIRKSSLAMLVLISLVIAPVTAFALFSQTVPTSNPAATAILTSTCTGTTQLTLNATTPILGGGTERLRCGTAAAFTSNGGLVTPTFTLGAGYTSLGYVPNTAANCLSSTTITSGVSSQVLAGSYDYCAFYSSSPGTALGSFTITWSQ